MPASITMPQQTDTMTEGTVVKWHKKEGDKIKAGEVVVDIETDKATMEIEAFDTGTLAAIVVAEGARATVGAPIAVLAIGNENPADVKKNALDGASASRPATQSTSAPAAKTQAAKTQAAPTLASASAGGPSQTSATYVQATTSEVHESADVGHGATRERPTAVPPLASGHGNGDDGNGHRVFASPLARRIAADKGLDLSNLKGTGPGGRIVKSDVDHVAARLAARLATVGSAQAPAAASSSAAPASLPPAARVARGEKEVIPLTKMRLAIARGLQKSKQTVPHFYVTIEADVEELSNLRGRLNELLKAQNVKLSISDFISKAVSIALLKHPALNAHYSDDGMTRYGDVNLGIAVAIPDGLIVPVLRGVDQMGLAEIRQRSDDLVKRARQQKLKSDEGRGATFTISNLGTFGVKDFSAIINPPEVGILAVSSAEKRAVVRGDAIVARTMMNLTLSADHRAVDGAAAADFMRTLKSLLEEPGLMLA